MRNHETPGRARYQSKRLNIANAESQAKTRSAHSEATAHRRRRAS
jgi:hypothetical protein